MIITVMVPFVGRYSTSYSTIAPRHFLDNDNPVAIKTLLINLKDFL